MEGYLLLLLACRQGTFTGATLVPADLLVALLTVSFVQQEDLALRLADILPSLNPKARP